jgi:hypothetical protein
MVDVRPVMRGGPSGLPCLPVPWHGSPLERSADGTLLHEERFTVR